MKIGITGDRGALCLGLADYISKAFHTDVEKISLFGDEWKQKCFDYDVLIHIAGVVPKPGVLQEEYYTINRDLTAMVAEKACTDGTKHVVTFSTMAVYGTIPSVSRKGGWVTETTVPKPSSDYGISKLEGEDALRKYENEELKVTYLRIPSVYFEGNTLFLNVAREMYGKFPKWYPKLYPHHIRAAIYSENLFALIRLVIDQKRYGIVCPQDKPELSLYDYMSCINQANGNPKKPSVLLGMVIKIGMLFKPSWRQVFGRVAFAPDTVMPLAQDYQIWDSKAAVLKCLAAETHSNVR